MRRVGQEGAEDLDEKLVSEGSGIGEDATHPAHAVAHDQDEAVVVPTRKFLALLVQRPQTRAVLLDAVDERPVRDELEPGRDEEPDFFAEGAR